MSVSAQHSDNKAPQPSTLNSQLLSVTLRDTWDKLGLVVGISLTWALLLAGAFSLERLVPHHAPLPIHVLTIAALLLVLLPGLLVGTCHAAHLVTIREEVGYADFWRGGLQFYPQSLRLTLCHFVVEGILGVNAWFYARLGGVFGWAMTLLCLYLLLFWSMMATLHFPLLVAQEMSVFDEPEKQAKRGTVAILRRAFYLTLGRPFFVLGLLAACALIAVVFSLTGVLFVTIGPGLLGLLVTHAVRGLLVRFGVLPPPQPPAEVIPDEKFRLK